jgi:hypothetical protein
MSPSNLRAPKADIECPGAVGSERVRFIFEGKWSAISGVSLRTERLPPPSARAHVRRTHLRGGALCPVALPANANHWSDFSSMTARISAMPDAAFVGGMPPTVAEVAAEVPQQRKPQPSTCTSNRDTHHCDHCNPASWVSWFA